MSRRGARRGFTVIEALAAGIILAGGSTIIALSVRQGLRAIGAARHYEVAAELLDQTLSRVDLIGPDAMLSAGPASGQFGPPYEQYAWTVQIEPLSTSHLYEVTARIDWSRASGGRGSVEAQTLMHDAPGSRVEGLEWTDL